MKRRLLATLGLLLILGAVACTNSEPGVVTAPATRPGGDESTVATVTAPATNAPAEGGSDEPASSQSEPPGAAVPGTGRTYHQADGNRLVAGKGDLPRLAPLDIPLAGVPAWITAVPHDEGVLWAVVLEGGGAQTFEVTAGQVEEVVIPPQSLPPGMPPFLVIEEGEPRFLVPADDFSTTTHPVLINDDGDIAYVSGAGDLAIERAGELTNLPVNALPDARILVDEAGRVLLLTDPTTAYSHGVLGDEIEAASVTLVETNPEPRIAGKIVIEEPYVIEGIAPLWHDLNGDGRREIIVTRTNDVSGAQIVAYAEDGRLLAAGPAIGRGFRWRHQLAVAPFGPAGEIELVDVLTPHIGGVVEFYRMEGETLAIETALSGYTSHVIGTRNLDMAVAGDFDGSGRVSLLLPNQARTELAGIGHGPDGAGALWSLPLGGTVVTNLAATALTDGSLAVGAGRQDGVLRIWQP